MGRERHEFSPLVRIHHHASHLIVYVINQHGIEITRLLHDTMDVDIHLE